MINVLAPALAATFLALAPISMRGDWAKRDIHLGLNQWLLAALMLGSGALTYLLVPDAPWQIHAAGALATGLAVLAAATDLTSHKIPKEPCIVVAIAGPLLWWSAGDILRPMWFDLVATAIIVVGVPFFFGAIKPGSIGFGDVRFLAAITLTCSWWAGYTALTWGLMAACLLQFVVRRFRSLTRDKGVPFGPSIAVGMAASIAYHTLAW